MRLFDVHTFSLTSSVHTFLSYETLFFHMRERERARARERERDERKKERKKETERQRGTERERGERREAGREGESWHTCTDRLTLSARPSFPADTTY